MLKLEELDLAMKLLIRENQRKYKIEENPKENQFLDKDNVNSPSDQIVYQHNRITGRPKTPIVKAKSQLGRLIIQKVHRDNLHIGPLTTLGIILDKFSGDSWRVAVKSELKRCSTCRKSNNHAFREAPPGDLPERRTNESRPFQHVGVDFMGPFKTYIRNSNDVEKSHIALFTCTTTRLIHLEHVRNLSTDEFLLALSRFMSRRGYPDSITSDNAATFKLTAEILDRFSEKEDSFLAELAFEKIEKLRSDILEKEMTKKGVKWYFNTALAPWQGGFYERLVGVVKKSLKHCLGDSLHNYKDLETIMAECECLVNKRPLTYIDDGSEDFQCLRPIDIITPGLYFSIFEENGLRDEYFEYTSNFREVKKNVKRFWDIFHRDYIKQLKTFQSLSQPNRVHSNLVKPILGEVVLLKDEDVPRKQWKMGIITELMKGRDGEIRSVRVRTTQKRKVRDGTLPYKPFKIQEITRPLRLVIPLELRPQSSEDTSVDELKVKVNHARNLSHGLQKHRMSEKKMLRPVLETQNDNFRKNLNRKPNFSLWNIWTVIMLMCILATSSVTASPNKLKTATESILLEEEKIMNFTTITIPIPSSTTAPKTTTSTSLPTTTPRKTTKQPTTQSTTTQTTPSTTTTESTIRTTSSTTTQVIISSTAIPSTTTIPTTKPSISTTSIPTTRSSTTSSTTTTTVKILPTSFTSIPTSVSINPTFRTTVPNVRSATEGFMPKEDYRRSIQATKPSTEQMPLIETTTSNNMHILNRHEIHDSKSRLECTANGVNLIDEENMTSQPNSVCTENWCDHQVVTKKKVTEVIIPPEYTVHKHRITWKKSIGQSFVILSKVCPPTDYCWKANKHFDCIFCTRFLFNSQCHPKATIAIVISLIAILMKLITLCWQRTKLWKLFKLMFCWCNFCEKLHQFVCCKKPQEETDELEEIEMVPLRKSQVPKRIATVRNWRDRIRHKKYLPSRSTPSTKRTVNFSNSTTPSNPRTLLFEVSTVEEEGRDVLRIRKASSRSPSPPTTFLAIATLSLLISSAATDVCDSTYPISHEESTCNELGVCRVERTEDIFFTPETKTICLQVVSTNNVLLKFKLTVDHNFRKCQKGPIMFTKNVTVHADSSKRCHGMGECVDRKCLDVGPNSKLSEFTEGNKYPGHTYCSSSCGGLWCRCLLPTEACLFYRTYAVPTTDDKFQIYSCDTWSNAIHFTASLTFDNQVIEQIFQIREGGDYQINFRYGKQKDHEIDLKFRLLEVTGETGLSILGKKFIQNEEKIALASITNEIFPLECTESGDCNYRETCNCNLGDSEAICLCKVPDLFKILDDRNHNLPIITERYHLGISPDNIPTIRMRHNNFHLQLIMEQSYHTNIIESKIDCSIEKTTAFIGCYNCLKGASQNVTCKSKEPTHAKLSCDNEEFVDILTCDKKGIVNEIHRKFYQAYPKGVCTVSCGNKNNSYKIEGTLTYVSHTSLSEYFNQVLHSEKSISEIHPWNIPDYWTILNTIIKGAVPITLAIIGMLFTSAILYLCCIPACTNFLTRRRRFRIAMNGPSITSEIIEAAKQRAITIHTQRITDQTMRAIQQDNKPPAKCRLCKRNHLTYECTTIPQDQKLQKCLDQRLCILCLNKAFHHPTNCRLIKKPHLLCKNYHCGKKFAIHHASICDKAPEPVPITEMDEEESDQ
ncbi:hypothetical protein CRE_02833 [Caenorhabditis remanei]|uniref:Integrase catalytic domain-containing protein n=1 Tax=Caenorhabditis remanei TaxID=31234 RepID=E3LX80_CAERE|nr:hypothetical protein CRE_02833 [Caenorhabditis remanei]